MLFINTPTVLNLVVFPTFAHLQFLIPLGSILSWISDIHNLPAHWHIGPSFYSHHVVPHSLGGPLYSAIICPAYLSDVMISTVNHTAARLLNINVYNFYTHF